MIERFVVLYKGIKDSPEYKKVFSNFSFLSILNLGNYALPLLTLPYLINVLGSDSFGQIMFAQAFVQYFISFVDYGFNFSSTREIALNIENKDKVSEIFCSVMLLKTFFFLICLIVFVTIINAVDKFSSFPSIYVLSFLTVVGNVIFPTWFFQGLEKMKYITIVNLSSKIISTLLIFLLVKNESDLLLVPIIYSVASIVPNLIALTYARKIYSLTIKVPPLKSLISEMKGGWFIFLSSISTSLYSVSNTFLIGILFNNAYAGYYSFAEKIIRACTSLLIPLNNALFPFMSLKMKSSQRHGEVIFRKILFVVIIFSAVGSTLVYFGSDFLIILVKKEFYPSIAILKILSPLLMIVAISNLIGFQLLFTTGKEKVFLFSVFVAGLLNLFFCFLLSDRFLYRAPAISLLISETFICFTFILYSRKILFHKI